MSPTTDGGGGIRAVSRAWQVLRTFTPERMSLTLNDLVHETGLPRTTVLRLVETLAGEGLVESGADGRVRVGTSLIAFAAFAEAAWTVPAASMARMRALAAETGETVSLYVREGVRRVVVGQAPSPSTLRHVVEPGDALTMGVGSAAYVLLSLEPAEERERLVGRIAEESGGDPEALRAGTDAAAERGWCVTHGQREPGNSGLAVPVPSPAGAVLARPAVLAVGGPTVRFTEDKIPGFVHAVLRCAEDIARTGLPPALY
ncbi:MULTISPECIES: IclR family transcriptional regulator [Streptomyces]|uniref:IclR family transcriptional regulator n=1 Tax=Streptomyces TaxID=1883 RepID=UPI00056C9C1E|nr:MULTISPECIES: helix-turn-helix domain-containing protein [Streptomyces]AOW89859.1 IclR family transcriptional regulator [Streptomyces olivaceus]MBZ6085228.1 helix-turn-helix domain-containing protein [Streptomyces olivaceus]MBZ6114535.1 helix-turn-helix domain-containing protein [Streptomyces olivaceus]MBZ6128352.1 helix-turn-helix domain-containing protein [Streptomyces olivaceus]MBZ6149240.1 helix-turn-helix domain-containing protein [Streptomyces olivaceus]